MTLNYPMAKLRLWRLGNVEYPLSLLPSQNGLGMVATDRVLSMGQIEQTVCKKND